MSNPYRARALLASSPDQDDATLKSIREHTPRYRMSVIISTNDSCIDTRMNVIWSALNSDTEILESVSFPEKLFTSEPRTGCTKSCVSTIEEATLRV